LINNILIFSDTGIVNRKPFTEGRMALRNVRAIDA